MKIKGEAQGTMNKTLGFFYKEYTYDLFKVRNCDYTLSSELVVKIYKKTRLTDIVRMIDALEAHHSYFRRTHNPSVERRPIPKEIHLVSRMM